MPTFALNFYNPAVAEQLRTGRKTATIRLGDKSAKYRKGMIVTVLCGVRYGQRERIFDAVIDKVEVKALRELSPREIEHDNPQIRRVEEMVWFLSQLYNREVGGGRHRHPDPLLANHVGRDGLHSPWCCGAPTGGRGKPRPYLPGRRMVVPKSSESRTGAPHSSHSTANADAIGASQLGHRCRSSPPHCGHAGGREATSSGK